MKKRPLKWLHCPGWDAALLVSIFSEFMLDDFHKLTGKDIGCTKPHHHFIRFVSNIRGVNWEKKEGVP